MHPKASSACLRGDEDGGWLLIELGGDSREEAADNAERARDALRGATGLRGTALLEEPGAAR